MWIFGPIVNWSQVQIFQKGSETLTEFHSDRFFLSMKNENGMSFWRKVLRENYQKKSDSFISSPYSIYEIIKLLIYKKENNYRKM